MVEHVVAIHKDAEFNTLDLIQQGKLLQGDSTLLSQK